jgi:hypothetical protein
MSLCLTTIFHVCENPQSVLGDPERDTLESISIAMMMIIKQDNLRLPC